MKNSIKKGLLAMALVLGLSIPVLAQSTGKGGGYGSGIRLSVGPDAGIPVGTLNKGYNWNFGGSVQGDFPILNDELYATFNAGYNAIFANKDTKLKDINLIPLKAGLKYFLIKQVYIQGDAGVSFLTDKDKIGATKSAAFVYAPQAGVLLDLGGKNYIDAGFRFESNSKFYNNGDKNNFIGLRVAYAFNL